MIWDGLVEDTYAGVVTFRLIVFSAFVFYFCSLFVILCFSLLSIVTIKLILCALFECGNDLHVSLPMMARKARRVSEYVIDRKSVV